MAPSSDFLDLAPDSGSIADTAEQVRQLLSCCQEIHDEDPRKLAFAQLARFNLWASNIGVFAPRHASLDYRLRTAPVVKVAIQGNLDILCRHLLSILKATTELSEEELNQFSDVLLPQTYEFGSKLVQASSSNDKLRLLQLGLVEDTIGILHQLSLAIRKASNRDSLTTIPRLFDRDSDYTIIREHKEDGNNLGTLVKAVRFEISSTFEEFVRKVLVSRWLRPDQEAELDSEQKRYREALINRSVEAVSLRRQQLAYFRNHQLKLAGRSSAKFLSSTRQPTDQEREGQPKTHLQNKHLEGLNPVQPIMFELSDAAPSETVGSELQSTAIRLAPPSSAPSSTVSSNAEGDFRSGGPFEVPPPPKLDAEDKEKACPYCCLVLPAKTFSTQKRARKWERHLLEDLQPYICLFENCHQRKRSYSSFKDWQAHLSQPHSLDWLCPLHPEDTDYADGGPFLFDKLANFRTHLDIYHSDLDPSSTDELVRRSSQPAMLPQWCFVCFEELPALPVLQKHMANHFKSMSLLSLPWREDIDDDEALASDQLKSAGAPSNASNASPLSETDLASTSLFEDADIGVTLAPSLKPKDFASLLSIVNANPITAQDRVNNLESWTNDHDKGGVAIVDPNKEEYPDTDSDDEKLRDTIIYAPEKTPKSPDICCPICLLQLGTARSLHSHIVLHLERYQLFGLARSMGRETEDSNEGDSDKVNVTFHAPRDEVFDWDIHAKDEHDQTTSAAGIAQAHWKMAIRSVIINMRADILVRVADSASKKRHAHFHDLENEASILKKALRETKSKKYPDTRPFIEILPTLTNEQILDLRAEYKKQVKTPDMKGVNIAKHIKVRLKENKCFLKVCYATALGRWESEAYWANLYYQGPQSTRELLIESLMGRTNNEIRQIKDSFRDKKYSDSLTRCMKQELKEDKFKRAVLMVLEEKRMDEHPELDRTLVEQDVRDLYRAIKSEQGGETIMISIVVQRSNSHMREILRVYEASYRANFAREMLKKSGNLVGEMLAHILNGIINRPVRDVLLLHHALTIPNSNSVRVDLIISRLVRYHWDRAHMDAIKKLYRHRYSIELQEAVREGTDGAWGEFCEELCVK